MEGSGHGKIVILRKSPYEILNDNDTALLSYLKKFYASWGADERLASFVRDYLSRCDNPYVTALKLMYCTGDFHASKPKSLAVFIITIFADWLRVNMASPFTDSQIKLDALRLILEQNNAAFRDLVIRVFNMAAENEIFLPCIQDLLQKKHYKEACQVAGALKLHNKFSPEDFLLPLCVQDKVSVVEEFVGYDKTTLHVFLKYMDALLVGDTFKNICDIIGRNEIPEWKVARCGHKPLTKLMMRLLKKHNIPFVMCPNMALRRQRSALHYLIAKRFESQEAHSEGWAEMAIEAVGDSKELQKELIECVLQRGEIEEAEAWARRFNLPNESWPPQVLQHSLMKGDEVTGTSCQSADTSEETDFFTLPFANEQVVLVDDAVQFVSFLEVLEGIDLVGLDAEWKPSFGMKDNELALIQVATRSQVFILDRPALTQNVPEFATAFVDRLMHNKSILKLGFDLSNDVKALRTVLPGLKDTSCLLDLSSLRVVLIDRHHLRFPYSIKLGTGPTGGKLKDLVELCLGKTLDKTEQCSNWERRPLRPSQVHYAALDAYCLIEVYDVIRTECEQQGINLKNVIEEMNAGKSPPRRQALKLPITVRDLHFICTWELCRLLKRLRRCGIDTLYNDTRQPSKKHAKLMQKGYVVLTTVGQPWVTRGIRSLRVPAVDEKAQLHHVLSHFGVEVVPQDINTRCPECNGTDFMDLSGAELRELRSAAVRIGTGVVNYLPPEEVNEISYDDDDYEDYDEPEPGPAPMPIADQGPRRYTQAGAYIQAEQVPPAVADEVSSCTICNPCGIILWPVSLDDMFLYD